MCRLVRISKWDGAPWCLAHGQFFFLCAPWCVTHNRPLAECTPTQHKGDDVMEHLLYGELMDEVRRK